MRPITIPRILMAVVSSIGVLSNSLSAWYFLRYGNTNDYGGKLILTLTLSDTANCISHVVTAVSLFSNQNILTSTFMVAIGTLCIMHANAVTIFLTYIRFLRIRYPFMVISYQRFSVGAIVLFIITILPGVIYIVCTHRKEDVNLLINPMLYIMTLLTISMIVVLVITVVTIRMYVVATRGQQEGGNIEATLATRKRALATVVILNTIYVVTIILIVIQLSFVIKLKLYGIIKVNELTSTKIGLLYTLSLLIYVLPSVLRPLVHFTRNSGLKSYLCTSVNGLITSCG